MKQVKLNVTVYYTGPRYIPYLENPKYGKFPLKEDKDKQFFENVPLRYAKSLVEGTPAMFSLEEETVTGYDQYSDENLVEYAKSRGISQAKNMKRENIINRLIQLDKKEGAEPDADALTDV